MNHASAILPGVLVTLAAALALANPVASLAQQPMPQHAQSQKGGGHDMHQSMSAGMDKMMSMKPSGDTDRDFATMMKMHHEMAIDMAKAEQVNGKSPQMKSMAVKIQRDSQRDIEELDKWLEQNKR